MEYGLTEYIRTLLENVNKLEPIPTGVKADFYRDETIRAVIFDIYGTLLISSSGDVDQADLSADNLARAFKAGNIELIEKQNNTLEHILYDFEYTINICHNEARKNQVPYPEIDILSVWEIVLLHARRKNLISFNGDANILQMVCVFEFLSNRVFPMPFMAETIAKLNSLKIPIGIVSNAQFYTPVLMNYFITNKIELSEEIEPFDPELTVYSYKLGIGKPDVMLYNELIPVLKRKYSLTPGQVLFVGNDMLKDVYAGSMSGFKTALFAGDRRSLRLRSNDERVKELKPDHIITSLDQVLEILDV